MTLIKQRLVLLAAASALGGTGSREGGVRGRPAQPHSSPFPGCVGGPKGSPGLPGPPGPTGKPEACPCFSVSSLSLSLSAPLPAALPSSVRVDVTESRDHDLLPQTVVTRVGKRLFLLAMEDA